MTSDNKKIFCAYYDQGLLIEAAPDGGKRIAMCCWQKRIKVDTVDFNHLLLTDIRKKAQNTFPEACNPYCNIDNHINNERQQSLKETWWDNAGQRIKKLHLKQGLICNLKCISCSSILSSAWNGEYQKFVSDAPNVRLIKNPNESWKDLDLQYLEQLTLDGGEPLLNDDNVNILKHLDSLHLLPNITVNYYTNATIFPSDELISLWKKCHWVRLFFSLDGVGSTLEYTRYPAKWNEVCTNLYRYQKIQGPCLLLEINATVGVHNIFNLKDFYSWWKTHYQFGNQGDPTGIFVRPIEPSSHGGQVLQLENLPEILKSQAEDLLNSIVDLPGAQQLIPLLSKNSNDEWLGYFKKLDEIRGTNWRQSLPIPLSQYKI